MCGPDARGPGWIADDIYALGATTLVLALGYNPTAGMDRAASIEAKLTQGSYIALPRGGRSPPGLREPLRGMLADHIAERWGFEDIERWLSGASSQVSPADPGDQVAPNPRLRGQGFPSVPPVGPRARNAPARGRERASLGSLRIVDQAGDRRFEPGRGRGRNARGWGKKESVRRWRRRKR